MVHDLSATATRFSQLDEASTLATQAWISRLDSPLQTSETGPLAGLSFAVKDNIDALGLPTTAACPRFSFKPNQHAPVVQCLLDSGASLLGKTNLDQFACGLNGSRSPYGAVPNAFDAPYVSGGSSAGSAYVVATGQVDFALGTNTAGSGRVPAGLNNIVGLKPSKGLISARGVVPAAQSVDCVSIFARTLAMATKALPAAFRFGVPDSLEFFADTLEQESYAQAIDRLTAMGGIRVDIDYAPLPPPQPLPGLLPEPVVASAGSPWLAPIRRVCRSMASSPSGRPVWCAPQRPCPTMRFTLCPVPCRPSPAWCALPLARGVASHWKSGRCRCRCRCRNTDPLWR